MQSKCFVLMIFLALLGISLVQAQEELVEIDYQSRQGQLTNDLGDEGIAILNDINDARLRNGSTHMIPNTLLTQVARTHLSHLISRDPNNLGDTCKRSGLRLTDWLVQATYPNYAAPSNYEPNMIALASSPQGGLTEENFIEYWIAHPDEFLQCNNTGGLSIFDSRHRELGIAHAKNRNTSFNYFVIIFASQPNALPVVVVPDTNPLATTIPNMVSSREVVLSVSNEYASVTGNEDSVGTVTAMKIAEEFDNNAQCPETVVLDNDWTIFDPFPEYTLTEGVGEKVIYVYLCDDFGRMAITSVTINYSPSQTTIYEPPDPIPYVVDSAAATQLAINSTQAAVKIASAEAALALTGTQSQLEIQSAQTELASTEIALRSTQFAPSPTPTPSSTLETSNEPSPPPSATADIAMTQTTIALVTQQVALNATGTAQEAAFEQTRTGLDAQASQIAAQATADAFSIQGTATGLALIYLSPTPSSSPTLTLTPSPTVPSPTPAIEIVSSTSFIDLVWRQSFLVIINSSPQAIYMANLAFVETSGARIALSEWSEYSEDAAYLSSGGCFVAYVDEEAPSIETLGSIGVTCLSAPFFLQVGPQDAVWAITNGERFTVEMLDGTALQTCYTREAAPICTIALPSGTQMIQDSESLDIEIMWTNSGIGKLLLQNISETSIDVSNLSFTRGTETFNVSAIIGNNSLHNLNPRACVLVADQVSIGTEAGVLAEEINPAADCSYVVDLRVSSSELIWLYPFRDGPFTVRGGSSSNNFNQVCDVASVNYCRFALP